MAFGGFPIKRYPNITPGDVAGTMREEALIITGVLSFALLKKRD